MSDPFALLDITELTAADPSELEAREDVVARRAALDTPRAKSALQDPRRGAVRYQASPQLQVAINTALALEMPLLVAGEPGTGKTQVAWFLAAAFGLGEPLVLPVRSTTTARALLYDFDAIGDFRDGQESEHRDLNRARHVVPGPLWRALTADDPRVLLIDEVDKAPRDFPNDLLDVLDRFEFPVPELERLDENVVRAQFGDQLSQRDGQWWVRGRGNRRRPIVVLTTNAERRLPEPFLRRCIFHVIDFTPDLVKRIVAAHREADLSERRPMRKPSPDDRDSSSPVRKGPTPAGDGPGNRRSKASRKAARAADAKARAKAKAAETPAGEADAKDAVTPTSWLPEAEENAAIDAFMRLRQMPLRKKPSTAELLSWLRVLAMNPHVWPDLKNTPALLPLLPALIKTQEDLATVQAKGG